MDYGRDLDTLLKIEAGGFPVPQLEERPTPLGYVWLWEAFITLQTCRQIGMDVGPIPWTATYQYARSQGLNEVDFYILVEVMSYLDGYWRDCVEKRREKSAGKG
jgi:hypothetical protein